MSPRVPIQAVFLIGPWAEALCYGFFACIFCAMMYITFGTPLGHGDHHSRVMVVVSSVMFFLATFHLVMNCFRLFRGLSAPEGPAAYIGNLTLWDHVLKTTIYATQEIFGNAVAIYRCYMLWNRRWVVVFLPCCLFIVSVGSGYTICALFTKVDPTATVFNRKLDHWILTFYSVAVVQNIITTALMAYRIWSTVRATAAYVKSSVILPVARILLESAALQLLAEILLLALYAANINVQYVLLECITPIIGITFIMITIRVKLYRSRVSNLMGLRRCMIAMSEMA